MVKILLVSAALLIATVSSCKCPDYTPEYGACNSEFVIQAKVTGDEKGDDVTTYQLQVERVFKNNAEFDEVIWGGRTLYATTPENGACRIYLLKGELYLITGKITGGKVDVGGCDFVSVWTDLTEEAQAGFEKNYYGNCKKKEVVENAMENTKHNVVESVKENVENNTQAQNNNSQQNSTLELQNNNNTVIQGQINNSTATQGQNSVIPGQNSNIQLQTDAMQLQNNTLQLQNSTLQLQNNIFKLQNNTLQLQNNTLQSQNKTKSARKFKLM